MKHAFVFTITLLTALLASATGKKTYDVAAYIWPAYHDEPRYQDIGLFPDHKGEWEGIYNAKPRFEGHRQPRVPVWGYFDESSPKMQEKIIRTATKYGVNTFIFDWYWYDGRPFLESVINNGFLKAKNCKKMKFYLMWANHTANTYWDRTEPDKSKVYWNGETSRQSFDSFTDHIIQDYFKQPNYYQIDGKPVFAIYEIGTFIRGMGSIEAARDALQSLRDKCVAAGLPGLHLQAIVWSALPASLSGTPGDNTQTQDNTLAFLGFNSITNYQWCHLEPTNRDYEDWGNAAIKYWDNYDKLFTVPYFPHVSIDWDPNPRFPMSSPVQGTVYNITPQKFQNFLKKAKTYADEHPKQVPLITINAWNEWAEGSYLEPDTENGYGFLKAIKAVFK